MKHAGCLFCLILLSVGFLAKAQVIRGLSADFLNASTLRISWSAASPSENVTGYDVIVLKGNTQVSRVTASNDTSSVTVPSLDQCSNYTVKVAANSTAGLWNYSSIEFVTRCVLPSIEPQSQTIYSLPRKPAFFPCNFTGFPTPTVYWTVTHGNTPTNITQGNTTLLQSFVDDKIETQTLTVFDNGTLYISEVDRADSAGQYQCTAVNSLGVATGDVKLTVVGVPPSIEPQSQTIYSLPGKSAVLPCNFTGFPTPTVYWTVTHGDTATNITEGDTKPLHSIVDGELVTQTLTVFDNGTLHISKVDRADSVGQYQCTAVNPLGVAKGDVKLTVVGGYATVVFDIEIVWTSLLQEHNSNGTLNNFLQQQVASQVKSFFPDLQGLEIGGVANVDSSTKLASMKLAVTGATASDNAQDKIEEGILKIAEAKAIGLLTLKSVIISSVPPPPPTNLKADKTDIQATYAFVTWELPHHPEVYEVSEYTVQSKEAVKTNADFRTEMTVGADVTGVRLTELDPDTEYLVRVVSHRKNAQQTGKSKSLEIKTIKDPKVLQILLVLVLPIVLAIVIVAILIFIKCQARPEPDPDYVRRYTMDDELQRQNRRTYGPATGDRNIYEDGQLRVALPPIDFQRQWPEIPRDYLKLGEELGAGAFGVVKKGYLMRNDKVIECAVKMLKKHGTELELRDLFNELNIMASVSNHPNVVSLIGACSDDGPLWVIVKFAENGCLLDYIRKHRKTDYGNYLNTADYEEKEQSQGITYVEKLRFAYGIAKGMNHLSKVKCVHRDLACRNVLLGKANTPMVSDFGLARDIYESGAYETTSGGKLPVRWMPLESLQDYTYTSESDVWAFGVVLWEIETGGQVPYAALGGQEIVAALQRGERLPRPDDCTDEIFEIMRSCWHPDPKERPSFAELVQLTDSLLSEEAEYLEVHADVQAEEEEDEAPYDEVRFSRIPEEFLSTSDMPLEESPRLQPHLEDAVNDDMANGEVTGHAHERNEGDDDENTTC